MEGIIGCSLQRTQQLTLTPKWPSISQECPNQRTWLMRFTNHQRWFGSLHILWSTTAFILRTGYRHSFENSTVAKPYVHALGFEASTQSLSHSKVERLAELLRVLELLAFSFDRFSQKFLLFSSCSLTIRFNKIIRRYKCRCLKWTSVFNFPSEVIGKTTRSRFQGSLIFISITSFLVPNSTSCGDAIIKINII